jgi:uncharacterized protein (DUF1501 family)
MDRRSLIQQFAILGATLPTWMPRLSFAAPPREVKHDILVCIFLRGGADGLNMVIPFGDEDYYNARKKLAIPAPASGPDTAIDMDGYFGLHPAMASLSEIYQAGQLAFVHAVGSPHETRSHFDAMDYMERGTPGDKSLASGWLNRHLQSTASTNDSPFRAVGMGQQLQMSLRGMVPAVTLQSIADFHLKGQPEQITEIQRVLSSLYTPENGWLAEQGVEVFNAFNILEKADPTQYESHPDANYPDNNFGMALKQVAQLIKADVGLEVACVDIGGWDTHIIQGGSEGIMANLLQDYAGGLAAFYSDLHNHLSRVTILTMSEFGRRVQENAAGGTDHGRGGVIGVMGGGINGGQVYGNWPTLHPDVLEEPGDLPVTTDFRDVLGEIIQNRMGNHNLDQVFPGYQKAGFLGVAVSETMYK